MAANSRLELEYVAPGKWVTLDGRFGVVKKPRPINPMETSELPPKNRRHIFSVRDLRDRTFYGLYYELAPEIYQASRFADVHPWLVDFASEKSIEEAKKPVELHLYDFDNTLFRSPYPPDGYEGDGDKWWRLPQSLLPPCVPQNPGSDWWNAKVVNAVKKSFSRKNVVTILATGRRYSTFKKRVHQLLKQRGLKFDEILMKGSGRTLIFKEGEIKRLIDRYNPSKIVVWEDRGKHLTSMVGMIRGMGIEVKKHLVPQNPHEPACSARELKKEAYKRRTGHRKYLYDVKIS